jgi:hypothetical protein
MDAGREQLFGDRVVIMWREKEIPEITETTIGE